MNRYLFCVLTMPVLAMACAGCPTPPAPTPGVPDAEITVADAGVAIAEAGVPDASPAAAAACANLRRLGCSEGFNSCESVFDQVLDAHLTDLRPACLTSANSKAEARACKSVKCP